ncbi:hypothetical protein Ntsu_79140 [Nocardia sp. IFM 10818]
MPGLRRHRGTKASKASAVRETAPTTPRRLRLVNRRAKEAGGEPVTEQAAWTGGQARLTTAIRWSMLAAMACGVVSLVLIVSGTLTPVPPAATPRQTTAADPGEQSAAAELATRLVGTWLQAARGDEKSFDSLVDTDRLKLPQTQAYIATDIGLARIETATRPAVTATAQPAPTTAPSTRPVTGAHLWTVTVSAVVRGVDQPPSAAARRYFQVPVLVTDGAARATALPAPVAAPPVAAEVDLGYRHQLVSGHPIWTTLGAFLAALTAGDGDIARYTAPGTRLRAITPPPYTAVTLLAVATDTDFTTTASRATPTDGTTTRVLATAELATTTPGHSLTSQYALTLAARGGRWEIAALDPAPALAAPAPATTAPATTPPPGPATSTRADATSRPSTPATTTPPVPAPSPAG